MLRVERLSHI